MVATSNSIRSGRGAGEGRKEEEEEEEREEEEEQEEGDERNPGFHCQLCLPIQHSLRNKKEFNIID